MLEDLVVGSRALGVGEVVEKLVVLTGGQRRVQRQVGLADGKGLGHFVFGDVHPLGDLLDGGLAAQLLEQRRGALADAVQRPRSVERHAHDARLLGQRLENRLADPPHRIRDELDALGLIELVRGADQPQVALVDQIRERDPLVLILLRHGDHKPQVGPHELVERLRLAQLDPLSERDLLLARDERILTDLPEVLVERPLIERGPLRCVQMHGLATLQARYGAAPDTTDGRGDGTVAVPVFPVRRVSESTTPAGASGYPSTRAAHRGLPDRS